MKQARMFSTDEEISEAAREGIKRAYTQASYPKASP